MTTTPRPSSWRGFWSVGGKPDKTWSRCKTEGGFPREAEYSQVDRKSGKAGVLAPTTHLHLHLPQRHPRPVHVQAKVTTTGSPDRMEFHQNVSCRSNDGTKAEERGRNQRIRLCAYGGRQ